MKFLKSLANNPSFFGDLLLTLKKLGLMLYQLVQQKLRAK